MDKAQLNLELLQRKGVLTRREASRDLRTLKFLEANPHRRLPRSVGDWVLEGLRFIVPWDPGPYFILRAVMLGGAELKTWRAMFRKTMVLAVVQWTLMMGGFAGFMMFYTETGNTTEGSFRGWANACPIVFAGGLIFAAFLYGILGRDLQVLAKVVGTLDGGKAEHRPNVEPPGSL